MDPDSPRKDGAKYNARRIQTEIICLLQANPNGLHFNEIFKRMQDKKFLNNYNILIKNLNRLMNKDLVKKTKVEGQGFGKSIYQWTGSAIDYKSSKDVNINMELSSRLPYVVWESQVEGQRVKRIHIQKGKLSEFKKAVTTLNLVTEYFEPVTKDLSEFEKQFFTEILQNMLLMLRIRSTILREVNSKDDDALWRVYFFTVVNNLERLFEEYGQFIETQPKAEISKREMAQRKKLAEVCNAMVASQTVDLNGVDIHETTSPSPLNSIDLGKPTKGAQE